VAQDREMSMLIGALLTFSEARSLHRLLLCENPQSAALLRGRGQVTWPLRHTRSYRGS
jgi:hypothetical protein